MAHPLQLMRPLVIAARGRENSGKMPPGWPGGGTGDRLSMKTFVTDWAAKPSSEGQLSGFRHWLFVRQEALRYALAPVAVAIAFLARLALTPILGDASPYLLFVPAVLTAAGLGGLGPGLLATRLSVVFGFFVSTISPSLSVPAIVDAALFTLIGVGIAWSGEQLQRNRIRAAARPRDGLAREAHLASILVTVPGAMIGSE